MPQPETVLKKTQKVHEIFNRPAAAGLPPGYRENLLGIFSIYNPLIVSSCGFLTPHSELAAGTAVRLPPAEGLESPSHFGSGRSGDVLHVFSRETLEEILPGGWNFLRDWGSGTILNPGVWGDWENFQKALGIFRGASPSKSYYFKTIRGVECVVFKGYQQLRSGLRSSNYYKLSDPRIVQLGIGVRGIYDSVKTGCFWTICIYPAMLSAEAVIRSFGDNPMSVGIYTANIATTTVKAALGSAATLLATAGVETFTTAYAAPLAIPGATLVAAFVLGVAVGWALNTLDNKFGITNALAARVDAEWARARSALSDAKQDVAWYTSDAYWTRQIIWHMTGGRCSTVQCLAGFNP